MRTLLLAIVLVGCVKENPDFCPNHPDDPRCGGGMGSDAGVDAPDADPALDASLCFGADNYEVCLSSAPSGSVTLEGTLDTTTDAACLATQPTGWTTRGQPASCFIVASDVTVNDVSVSGSRPLVIVASTIHVNGTLDAAAHEDMPTKIAPGAPFAGASCAAFPQVPTNRGSGAGGGAGGSFMTLGGNGGEGNNGQAGNHGGTAAPIEASAPVALRAGCSGQAGGNATASGGTGGMAGGAVYLVASDSIAFGASGIINVSGGGGHASSSLGGGGGGGAGGMIVLYATTINATSARLLANGGGGASGGNNGGGTAGTDPSPTDPTTQASSVVGPMNCCTSGKGYAGGMDATAAVKSGAGLGGGGGGGGGGYIQSNQPLTNATVSPVASVVP
jgi:hypothetical protein